MENLRTDFVDDILNASENTRRKFRMISNDDGTISFEDVTAYSQVGDSFGATEVNKTNGAVNELNESLQWKNVGLVTGAKSIDLPENFNELLFHIFNGGNQTTIYAVRNMLGDAELRLASGWFYSTSNRAYIVIGVSLTTASLKFMSIQDTDSTATTLMNVYYR